MEYIHNMQGQIHVFRVLALIWIVMDFAILNWKQNKSVIRDVSSHLFSFLVLNLSHEFLGDIPNVGPNSTIYILCTLLYLGMPSPFNFTNYTMSWFNEVIILFTFVAFKVSKYSFYTSNFQAPITFYYNSHLSIFIPSTFILA